MSELKPGQEVKHHFAGLGTVMWVRGLSTAVVKWSTGRQGVAYIKDLKLIETRDTNRG